MFTCLCDLRCEQCASCSLLPHHELMRDFALPFHQQTSRGAVSMEKLTQQFPARGSAHHVPEGPQREEVWNSKVLCQTVLPYFQYLNLTWCSDRKWKQQSHHMVGLWYSDFCICYLKDLCYASQTYCHALLAQKCFWHKKFGSACDFTRLLGNSGQTSTSSAG